MKKLLFVMAASFFCSSVYAQAKTLSVQSDELGPRELKCTEEAVSFSMSIRPGWQLSSFRLGPSDLANSSAGFIPSKNYNGEDIIIEPIQLIKYENGFNGQDNFLNKNFLFPLKAIKPFTQISQFATDHFFYNYANSLKYSNLNFLAPPVN
jgi:hypothetical protein